MLKPARVVQIEETIARAAGVTIAQLNSRNREQDVADARAAVWYILRDHLSYTFSHIGRMYGNRDHTTIISGVRRIRNMKTSEEIVEGVRKVCPEALQGAPTESRSMKKWNFTKE